MAVSHGGQESRWTNELKEVSMLTIGDVAKKFADGEIRGRATNMLIEGDVVYSYGYHHPIAKKISDGKFILNSDKASVTTAWHRAAVLNALTEKGMDIYECREANTDNVIVDTVWELQRLMEKFLGSNKRWAGSYLDKIQGVISRWHRYRDGLGLSSNHIEELGNLFSGNEKIEEMQASILVYNKIRGVI